MTKVCFRLFCYFLLVNLFSGCIAEQSATSESRLPNQIVVEAVSGTNIITQPASDEVLFVGETVHISAVLADSNIQTVELILIPVINNKLDHRLKRTWRYPVSNPQSTAIKVELDLAIPEDIMLSDDYRLQIGHVISSGTGSGYSQKVRIRQR